MRATAAPLVAPPRCPQRSVAADPRAAGRAIHLAPITRTTHPHAPATAPAIEHSNPIAHGLPALHSGAGQHQGDAGIKAMLSGSPTGNRNAGGPGLDANRDPGPRLILSKPPRGAYGDGIDRSFGHVDHSRGSTRDLTRTRQKLRQRY